MNKQHQNSKNSLKTIYGMVFCLLLRLVPFRPPNIEPVLATLMPFSRKMGAWTGFYFGFLSILFYDIITNKVGIWTWYTGLVYGLLGVASFFYFKNQKKQINGLTYAKFSIIATIFYDLLTGVILGPVFFPQTFSEAFLGQIPFTMMHLLGNVSFALLLSPVIDRFLAKENSEIINFQKIRLSADGTNLRRIL